MKINDTSDRQRIVNSITLVIPIPCYAMLCNVVSIFMLFIFPSRACPLKGFLSVLPLSFPIKRVRFEKNWRKILVSIQLHTHKKKRERKIELRQKEGKNRKKNRCNGPSEARVM